MPSQDKRLRRIAVEEAWVFPEMVEEIRKLFTATGTSNLDVECGRYIYGGGGLGNRVYDRLLDLDGVRIQDMDANGVDMQLLLLTTPGVQLFDADTATELAALSNDRLASTVDRHAGRYAGLAALAPQSPHRAAREMERAIEKLGLNGFVINSHTNGDYLDQSAYWPILEAAEALDRCIYIHPRAPSDGMAGPFRDYSAFMAFAGWGFALETATHAMRLIVSGVLDRFPKLQICLGHMGEGVHFWFKRLDNIMKGCQSFGTVPKLSLAPSEYFKRNFVITTSGVEDHEALRFSIDRLGVDNVLWAIDYPYEQMRPAVQFLDSAPVTDEERRKIYGENAERVFHIAKRPTDIGNGERLIAAA